MKGWTYSIGIACSLVMVALAGGSCTQVSGLGSDVEVKAVGGTCKSAADCPSSGADCLRATCLNGVCGTEYVAPDTECLTELKGPCQQGKISCDPLEGVICASNVQPVEERCDGVDNDCDGRIDIDAVTQKELEESACTVAGLQGACSKGTEICESGSFVCKQTVFPIEETCGDGDEDCDGVINNGALCCPNQKKDGDESDIDCGGQCGSTCEDGQACSKAKDCKSLTCGAMNTCQPAKCDDGMENGNESDIDCGGICNKCVDFKQCNANGDCQSEVCANGVCQSPKCDDMVANGNETDIDCGGTCLKCGMGSKCKLASDCAAGVCINGTCQAATCMDQVKNGGESDVDCGGPNCADCVVGKGCFIGSDCQSGVCINAICVAPTCSDMVKNGSETDIDCGGGCPSACAENKGCSVLNDCESKVCQNKVCKPPVCGDGQRAPLFEACDDGNTASYDGCSMTCAVELGFTCNAAVPNVCTGLCGDQYLRGNEQCDDGNTTAGDGCSAVCQWEILQEQGDFGDDQATAQNITLDQVVFGETGPGDYDSFALNLASSTTLRIETFSTLGGDCIGVDTDIVITNLNGNIVMGSSSNEGINSCAALVVTLSNSICGGTCYILVYSAVSNTPYYLQLKRQEPFGSESEPNDTIATADPMPNPPGTDVFMNGSIVNNNDVDYYSIFVPQGKSLRAETTGGVGSSCIAFSMYPKLTLYNPMGTEISNDANNSAVETCALIDGTGFTPLHAGAHNLPEGTYYVGVQSLNGNIFNYKLAVTIR